MRNRQFDIVKRACLYLCGILMVAVVFVFPVQSESMSTTTDLRTERKEQKAERRAKKVALKKYYAQLVEPNKKNQIERQRRRSYFEQFRVRKIQEFLELSEDQKEAFIKSFRQLRKEMVMAYKSRQELMKQLKKAIRKSGSSESQIYEIFAGIKLSRETEEQIRSRFMDRSKTLLSARQFGMLVLFQEQFDAQILGKLGERRRTRGPKGMKPPRRMMQDKDDG